MSTGRKATCPNRISCFFTSIIEFFVKCVATEERHSCGLHIFYCRYLVYIFFCKKNEKKKKNDRLREDEEGREGDQGKERRRERERRKGREGRKKERETVRDKYFLYIYIFN